MRLKTIFKGLDKICTGIRSCPQSTAYVSHQIQRTCGSNLSQYTNEISKTLSITKKETNSVLSLYEQYLKETNTVSNIDFSVRGIENFVIENFFRVKDMFGVSISQGEFNFFMKNHGFDILKDMIRTGTNKLSIEGSALHRDLKYLGLDSKTAEIVHKFEDNGINLITSNHYNDLNKKFAEFLEEINKKNLPKIKEINLMEHGIGNKHTVAIYCGTEKVIGMNPIYTNMKNGPRYYDINGKRITAERDFGHFIHEYFHFVHNESIGNKAFDSMHKSLFEYLIEKDAPEVISCIRSINEEAYDIYTNMNYYIEENNLDYLDKLMKIIRNNKSTAFEYCDHSSEECMKIIENAYKTTQDVATSIRKYAATSPLEAVAEGGMYKYFGEKLPDNVENLLQELGLPKFS